MAIQKRTIRKLMTVYNTPFCNESCWMCRLLPACCECLPRCFVMLAACTRFNVSVYIYIYIFIYIYSLLFSNEATVWQFHCCFEKNGTYSHQLRWRPPALKYNCWRHPALSARMSWRRPALEDNCWRHPAWTLSRSLCGMLVVALLLLAASRLNIIP